MKRLLIVLGGILSIALLGLLILIYLKEDKAGPVIQFSNVTMTYTEGEDSRVLLQGVTAYDKKDGDVSDTLLIESIIPLSDNKTAKVIYAAKDRNNHIVKDSAIVNYIEKQETVEAETKEAGLENAVQLPVVGTTTEPQSTKEAEPTTIPEPVKTEEEQQVPTQQQEQQVPAQQMEEQQSETEESSGRPVITLTQNKVYITKGDDFTPIVYVAALSDDKDPVNILDKHILIEGVYNRNKAGTYILEYYVLDSDWNRSESAYLKLYVKE